MVTPVDLAAAQRLAQHRQEALVPVRVDLVPQHQQAVLAQAALEAHLAQRQAQALAEIQGLERQRLQYRWGHQAN